MAATLTRAVLAGGRVFPAGTTRDDAKGVPDGDWWSDFTTPGEAPDEDPAAEVEDQDEPGGTPDEVEDQDEPGGTPDESWTNAEIKQYADDNGIDLGGATTKADMLAVIGG